METIYETVRQNPVYVAWIFGIVNALWVVFLYFNKKRHEKELENLKHTFNLDLEKRKKMYEMKSAQFEKYFRMTDEFAKKHQVDLPLTLQPIFAEYMNNYLTAQEKGDKAASTIAITKFGSQISKIMSDSTNEYRALIAETNSLKLIASDALAAIFDNVQEAYEKAFQLMNEFMNRLVELMISNDQSTLQKYQSEMAAQAKEIENQLRNLMQQMRNELKEI